MEERTIATNQACPVCGGADLRPILNAGDRFLHRPGGFLLLRCADCELVFVDPPLDDRELAAYYPDQFYGKPSFASERALSLFMSLRAALLRRAGIRGGRLLDVGAGAGTFLAAMRERGFDVAGMEPSAAGRARAERLGLDLRASLEDVARGPYDVITMWHVAEHVRDIVGMLRSARDLLAPGGAMIVAVPNAASLEARLFGDRWFHLDVPRHQLHFSAKSIERALSSAGLELVSLERFSLEYDPFGLVQSAYNLLPIEHNALYQLVKLGRPLGAFPALSRAVLRVAVPSLPVAGGAAAIAEWVLSRFGLNATMTAIARPRR